MPYKWIDGNGFSQRGKIAHESILHPAGVLAGYFTIYCRVAAVMGMCLGSQHGMRLHI